MMELAHGVLLPRILRGYLLEWDKGVEEIRLREGVAMRIVLGGVAYERANWREHPVTSEDLGWVLEKAGQGSVHTVLEQMKHGFISVVGGHRIGICGTAVVKNGEFVNFRHISSLAIRIAHEVRGIAGPLIPGLLEGGRLCSTLIISPPGMGKTTLLRDLLRTLSEGVGALRVGVADERGELCGCGDVGKGIDVMDGCPKAQALLMLLRGMNPQVLAVDEITDPDDLRAMEEVVGCGVVLLATAHGSSYEEMNRRPIYKALFRARIFSRLIVITLKNGVRAYEIVRVGEIG